MKKLMASEQLVPEVVRIGESHDVLAVLLLYAMERYEVVGLF